jgi:hypothetical protein
MAVLLVLIICPLLFGISFLLTTSYFIYKLMTSLNVEYSDQQTVRTIKFKPSEVTCCMGWLWKTCLDRTTNRIALSTFIIWYIVNICLALAVTVLFFVLFYYQNRIYI